MNNAPGFWPRWSKASRLVTIEEHLSVCRDEQDNRILETAVNGQAEVIDTGDADLLVQLLVSGFASTGATIFLTGISQQAFDFFHRRRNLPFLHKDALRQYQPGGRCSRSSWLGFFRSS